MDIEEAFTELAEKLKDVCLARPMGITWADVIRVIKEVAAHAGDLDYERRMGEDM